jgi:S1-C subfamily serine protease
MDVFRRSHLRLVFLPLLAFFIPAVCVAQSKTPQVSPADIYERTHSSVVIVIVRDSNAKPISQGSGFIVRKNRIVTNHHVVENAASAFIIFADGNSQEVEGLAADSPARDLAILVVNTGARPALKLGDELAVRQGDSVYALGAPEGLELSLTNGILSGFRDVEDKFLLQTTAPIAHGSSGGPLFDSLGRVIGVTTAFLSDSPGIYFSIGAKDVSRLLHAPSAVILPLASTPTKPPTIADFSAEIAEFAALIGRYIAEKGLTGRAKVQASGNTLVITGKLHPAEHGGLLKFLRDAPASVRMVDHIEFDDAPVPATGKGAIYVVTDLIATAILRGPAGTIISQCQTPCGFNDLAPALYGLEVQKEGYQPMQNALQVKAGSVVDQKVTLESLAKGLYITSKPAGADVFINGAKQSGQTPVTFALAPGPYNLVLRMPGYDAYAGNVQVKDNIQTQLDVQLKEKSTARVAWAHVETTPTGAEILVDGTSTGQTTPSRVQVPSGLHAVTLRLAGYQPVTRTIQATEGGTVNITNVTLQPK